MRLQRQGGWGGGGEWGGWAELHRRLCHGRLSGAWHWVLCVGTWTWCSPGSPAGHVVSRTLDVQVLHAEHEGHLGDEGAHGWGSQWSGGGSGQESGRRPTEVACRGWLELHRSVAALLPTRTSPPWPGEPAALTVTAA